MSNIFTRIIAGDIPCYKIYEDELTFAFLDIRPHALGHTLVVPKCEGDHFIDVPEPYYSAVFASAKKIGHALMLATDAKRIGSLIAGWDVPHFHLHLIPIHTYEELNTSTAHEESADNMHMIQQKIISFLND